MKIDDTYAYKSRLAKAAYRDIRAVMDKWEGRENLIDICCHWDECITVDDTLFHGHQLRSDQ